MKLNSLYMLKEKFLLIEKIYDFVYYNFLTLMTLLKNSFLIFVSIIP